MVDFCSLRPGDILRYTEHEDTNPAYFGHTATVRSLTIDGCYPCVELEVVAVDNGRSFISHIDDPSRLELVVRADVTFEEIDAMISEFT